MEQDNTVNADTSNGESGDTQDTQHTEEMVPASKLREIEETNRQLFERAKKAEGFVKVDNKWVKAPKPEEAVATKEKLEATTGELEAAQLDFFDLKGYSDDEEIAVFQNIMKRTGMSHREVIKDEYALSRIKSIRQEKEVKNAMPSSTKRGAAGSGDTAEAWVQKIEAGTAHLGDIKDFKTRAATLTIMEARHADEKVPPWQR